MMKRPYDEHKNQIGLTHLAGGRNNCRNSLLFDFPRMINPEETPQEEGSQEGSLEEGASREEEDTQGVEDTQEEEEYHPEDHQEAVGDHRHYLCRKYNKENWWDNRLQHTMGTGRRRPFSSMNGSYTGLSTTTTPL